MDATALLMAKTLDIAYGDIDFENEPNQFEEETEMEQEWNRYERS